MFKIAAHPIMAGSILCALQAATGPPASALVDVVPLGKSKRTTRKAQALAWTHSVEGRSSVRQEATLIGPVE